MRINYHFSLYFPSVNLSILLAIYLVAYLSIYTRELLAYQFIHLSVYLPTYTRELLIYQFNYLLIYPPSHLTREQKLLDPRNLFVMLDDGLEAVENVVPSVRQRRLEYHLLAPHRHRHLHHRLFDEVLLLVLGAVVVPGLFRGGRYVRA